MYLWSILYSRASQSNWFSSSNNEVWGNGRWQILSWDLKRGMPFIYTQSMWYTINVIHNQCTRRNATINALCLIITLIHQYYYIVCLFCAIGIIPSSARHWGSYLSIENQGPLEHFRPRLLSNNPLWKCCKQMQDGHSKGSWRKANTKRK